MGSNWVAHCMQPNAFARIANACQFADTAHLQSSHMQVSKSCLHELAKIQELRRLLLSEGADTQRLAHQLTDARAKLAASVKQAEARSMWSCHSCRPVGQGSVMSLFSLGVNVLSNAPAALTCRKLCDEHLAALAEHRKRLEQRHKKVPSLVHVVGDVQPRNVGKPAEELAAKTAAL
eukprot:120436-Chlamydomonas_euryale.AAC.7